MYLLYPTQQDAIDRADEEGKEAGFAYWTTGSGTRWLTEPLETIDGLWALDVTGYNLDELEQSAVTTDVIFPQPPEDLM